MVRWAKAADESIPLITMSSRVRSSSRVRPLEWLCISSLFFSLNFVFVGDCLRQDVHQSQNALHKGYLELIRKDTRQPAITVNCSG
jgi:hypothetical protein